MSSWVIWVIVFPSTSRDIESVVTQHSSISQAPCIAMQVRSGIRSSRFHLLPIHSHFPVAKDGSPLFHEAHLKTSGRAARPRNPVLNENIEAPTFQHVFRALPTETCKEHFFSSWSSKS